jgi:hypothetical protein
MHWSKPFMAIKVYPINLMFEQRICQMDRVATVTSIFTNLILGIKELIVENNVLNKVMVFV